MTEQWWARQRLLNGLALQFASFALRGDPGIVMQAESQDGEAPLYAVNPCEISLTLSAKQFQHRQALQYAAGLCSSAWGGWKICPR